MSNLVSDIIISGNLVASGSFINVATISSDTGFNLDGSLYSSSGSYIVAPNLSLGVLYPNFQLELSTDTARKLTTTTWTTGSDMRVKSDIQTANLERCVEIVRGLDLKYFEWKPEINSSDKHSLGWIAQDVKNYFPKSVTIKKAHDILDFHHLNSDQLIKVMFGALKKMVQDTATVNANV